MISCIEEDRDDYTGVGVPARLNADHQRLGDSVAALERLVDRLDDEGSAGGFLAHLKFVYEFCELVHFPLEDALLEMVLEAGLTPSERRVVFVNLAQHQQIYADAVEVSERSTGRGQSGSPGRGEFRARAEACVQSLRGHLEFESCHLQPLLRRHRSVREDPRLQSMLGDLLATVAGQPLERLAALDAASRAVPVC